VESDKLLKSPDGELYFSFDLFETSEHNTSEDQAKLLPVTFQEPAPGDLSLSREKRFEMQKAEAKRLARHKEHEVVVLFPPGFAEQLKKRSARLTGQPMVPEDAMNPLIFSNSSREKSKIALDRVNRALQMWMEKVGDTVLEQHHIPVAATRPFRVKTVDVAADGHKYAAIWSKLLPFVLLIWALTGAFYPAVDLCAGEKERGTLETLLCSPAERSEIVVGKLLTIMLFSAATAILNLVSLSLTGSLILSQMHTIEAPPWMAMVWLLAALLPVSALFSAICLALAALARSTKEGQYYLMPVMLITMPLVMLPMSPGVEMNLGNSLVPVMGIVLLLRTTLEGDYITAARYLVPALGVTLICCLFAIRWAIDQFNKETVLFRESERFDVNLWVKQLFRDREATPTVAAAFLCGLVILMLRFLLAPMLQPNLSGAPEVVLRNFTISTIVAMLAFIVSPALLMTVMLTRSARETLLLKAPRGFSVLAAVLLAVCIHPILIVMQRVVTDLYPVSPQLAEKIAKQLEVIFSGPASIWHLLLLVAVLPAICEELAFRGFILSGLRHLGHRRMAILITAVFFGLAHGFIHQSLMATFSGVIIGFIAVRTESIFPCIFYHATSNALAVLLVRFHDAPFVARLGTMIDSEQFVYHNWVVLLSGAGAILLLMYFRSLKWKPSKEEALQDALDQEQLPDDALADAAVS
jgi:sodium transport system permease protein